MMAKKSKRSKPRKSKRPQGFEDWVPPTVDVREDDFWGLDRTIASIRFTKPYVPSRFQWLRRWARVVGEWLLAWGEA